MSDRRILLVLLLIIAVAILLLGLPSTIGGQPSRQRVTFYHQEGITASGSYTDLGTLSCSYAYPMYTHLVITADSGEQFFGVCLDRGLLDQHGVAVDVFLPWGWGDWWRAVYGDYPTITEGW